jgi:hypothetical protein
MWTADAIYSCGHVDASCRCGSVSCRVDNTRRASTRRQTELNDAERLSDKRTATLVRGAVDARCRALVLRGLPAGTTGLAV